MPPPAEAASLVSTVWPMFAFVFDDARHLPDHLLFLIFDWYASAEWIQFRNFRDGTEEHQNRQVDGCWWWCSYKWTDMHILREMACRREAGGASWPPFSAHLTPTSPLPVSVCVCVPCLLFAIAVAAQVLTIATWWPSSFAVLLTAGPRRRPIRLHFCCIQPAPKDVMSPIFWLVKSK